MSTCQAPEGRPQLGSSGAYWSGGDCSLHGVMNKFMDEKVLRKTLEEIILKNGVATHLTHPMATWLGRKFTGVRKNGGLWWLPPDGETQEIDRCSQVVKM